MKCFILIQGDCWSIVNRKPNSVERVKKKIFSYYCKVFNNIVIIELCNKVWTEEEVWKIRMFLLFRPGVACHLSAVIYYWLRQTKLVIFNLTASDVRYNQHWLSWTDPSILPNGFFLSSRILSWEKFEKKCRRLTFNVEVWHWIRFDNFITKN